MNPKRWLTLALLAVPLCVAAARADDVTKNAQYTITRATLNAGDDAQPTVLVCERVGLRLTPNVAEPLGGPDVLINVDDKGKPIYRLRIGLFTPSPLNADNLDGDGNGQFDECEYLIGDMDCDGAVDFNDIDGFVLALIDCNNYYSRYPDCHCGAADINRDGGGDGDFSDIDGFIECLINGGCD